MLGIGFGEFTLIILVLIIVLGPERLPGFMKSVGKGIRSLRQASRDIRTAVGIDEMMREDVVYKPPARKPEPPRGAAPVSRTGLDEFHSGEQPPAIEAGGEPTTDVHADTDGPKGGNSEAEAAPSAAPEKTPKVES